MKKIMIGLMLGIMMLLPVTVAIAAPGGARIQTGKGENSAEPTLYPVAVDAGDEPINDAPGARKLQQAKQVRAQAKEKIQEAREIRQRVRESVQQRRQERETVKEMLKQCKGQETEDCQQKRKEAKGKTVGQLDDMTGEVLDFLESAKERVENSNIDESKKTEMLNKIEAEIQTMQMTKENLAGLDEESSAKDIKDAMRRIRHSLETAKFQVKNQVHAVAGLKIANVLRKTEHLSEKLEDFTQKLSEQGKDMGGIDIEKFDEKIDEANGLYEQAVKLRQDAQQEIGDAKADMMKQATEKLREAHQKVKEAHQMLTGIVKQLRERAGKSVELDTSDVKEVTDPDEVPEETEDEPEDNAEGNQTA